jgi:hypothetical protein
VGLRAVKTRCQMSCPIMSPKKNSKKYVKIVCPPMEKRPK